MINFNIFTGVLGKILNGEKALKISKSENAYKFISNEYKNVFSKDSNENFIIPVDEQKEYKYEKSNPIITVGNECYNYFMCEYRKNAPVHDSLGNIILSDDFVKRKKKL